MIQERLSINLLVLLVILALCTAIYQLLPYEYKHLGWPNIVVLNWHEYGYSKLEGKLVYNVGGVGAEENPRIYGGHQALSILIPYLIHRIVPNFDLSGLILYLLTVLLISISIYVLFRQHFIRFLILIAIVFSPGLCRTAVSYDPLTLPALIGIPLIAILFLTILGHRVNPFHWIFIMFVTILYIQLNWTTAFTLALIFPSLYIANKQNNRLPIIIFAIVTFVFFLPVLNESLTSKDFWTSESLLSRLLDYTIGSGGYGNDTNWARAIIRLTFVNTIALLPLLVLFLFLFYKCKPWTKKAWSVTLLPIIIAWGCVLSMRNYFSMHPWMASPIFISAIICSLFLLSRFNDQLSNINIIHPSMSARTSLFFLLFSVWYCFVIVMFFQENSRYIDSVASIVRKNTERSDIILISRNEQLAIIRDLDILSLLFDRQTFNLENKDVPKNRRTYLLSSQSQIPNAVLVCNSNNGMTFPSRIISHLLGVYRHYISKRKLGDRIEDFDRINYHLFFIPDRQSSLN